MKTIITITTVLIFVAAIAVNANWGSRFGLSLFASDSAASSLSATDNYGMADRYGPTATETATPISTPSDKVSWWRAEGNANDSVGSNNGTLMNGAGFASGMDGLGFDLNGTTHYVNVPHSSSLNPTDAITVEGWVKVDSLPSVIHTAIITKDNPMPGPFNLNVVSDGRASFGVFTSDWNGSSSPAGSLVPADCFYHVAGTFDATAGQACVYLNGAPTCGAVSGSMPFRSSNDVKIGFDPFQNLYLDGIVDEVALYDRALSAAEIQAIYDAGGPGKCISATDTPTDTPTGTPTDTPTDTPTAAPTNTATETATPTPTPFCNSVAFETDFESGVPSAFSGAGVLVGVQGYSGLGPTPNTFGGNFLHNDTAGPPQHTTLTMTGLPTHTGIDLRFLLAIINSWDGVGDTMSGPDSFNVSVDGNLVFSEVFGNASISFPPSYVPPPGVELAHRVQLYLPDGVFYADSAYDMGTDPIFNNIPHSSSTLTVEWYASSPNWEGGENESWAIENVRVLLVNGCMPLSIQGTITYGNAIGNPIPPRFVQNVSVASTAGSPAVVPVITGANGQYELTGFGAGSYTITPTKPGGSNGAINSFDAGRIAQHVAGLVLLTGNQRAAADVTGNGQIQSFDAAKIAGYVAGLPLSPPNLSGTWRFYTDPVVPFPPLPPSESRSYASVTSNVTDEDYTALLLGDVSGNWNPATHPRPAGKVNSEQWTVNSEGGGPERGIEVKLPDMVTPVDKEIVVPVNVQGVADKGIISYEFDLRYDPAVIQPLENPVDVAGTVSRGLMVVANPHEPGLLRVVVYGAMPIDENGVLLNLRFTAVGAVGSNSPLTFDRIMFNEGEPRVTIEDGQIALL